MPVKVGPLTSETILGPIVYADLTGCDEAEAQRRLLGRVRKAIDASYRDRPGSRPGFPGGPPREVPSRPKFPPDTHITNRETAKGQVHLLDSNVSRLTRAIGVDVGTTKIAAGLVEIPPNGVPCIASPIKRIDHKEKGRDKQLLEKIEEIIFEVIREEVIAKRDIDYIGVGLPGQVDCDSGCLKFAPGLKLQDIHVTAEIYSKIGLLVYVDNDVHCSTLAELNYGDAGRNYKDFVCIYVGTGIGGGIVINNKLFRGQGFSAGEIGHMKVDWSENAQECTCKGKGCFEEYASARAIVRLARAKIHEVRDREEPSKLGKLDPREVTPEDIIEAIRQNDELSMDIAKQVGRYLGIGIANILNILNPQIIVLGGGIIEGFYRFEFFKNIVRDTIRESALESCRNAGIMMPKWRMNTPIIGGASRK